MHRALIVLLLTWSAVPAARGAEPTPDAGGQATPAAPQAPKPWEKGVTEKDRAAARDAARAAADLYIKKELKQARELYARAVEAWNHPKIQYNRSLTLIELGDWVGAHGALREALRFGRGSLRDDNFEEAKRYQLLVAGNVATLKVNCSLSGAKVTLDGKELFDAPGEVTRVLLPGEHIVVATKAGYVTSTQAVNAVAGKVARVDIELLPQMRVRNVYPFGEALPWAVLGAGLAIAAGGIPLWVAANDSYQSHAEAFEAQCGTGCFPGDVQDTRVADLEDRAAREFGGSIAMFAIGGAATVAGIVLAVMNQPKQVEEPIGVGTTEVTVTPLPTGGSVRVRF